MFSGGKGDWEGSGGGGFGGGYQQSYSGGPMRASGGGGGGGGYGGRSGPYSSGRGRIQIFYIYKI